MEQARRPLDVGEEHGDRSHRPAHGSLIGHSLGIIKAAPCCPERRPHIARKIGTGYGSCSGRGGA
jgi:hypothetical protein